MWIALLGLFAAAVCGAGLGYLIVRPQYRWLTHRFLNIEETVLGISRHIGNTLEIHQRSRGAAVFPVPEEASPFDGRGTW